MSTSYGVHPSGSPYAEVIIEESSGFLQLGIEYDDGVTFSTRMTPEKAIAMAVRIIQAALYNTKDADCAKRDAVAAVEALL